MSSIVPGFEYDIFISYRHKDNKGEHWVTEFVNALKTELESTFKEDISIYFDENPHDGLLETHDVDDSLREKLKCLIFIPIISQTYCDPKSFAWNHEFLAFKKLASDDQFGLKIKLANGNVSSRILPVRIHELDVHDKVLLENEVGPLRAIDFIFKSAGVNRPLRAQEDHPNDNLNKTYFRDQVNKVANAVKEIVTSFTSKNRNVVRSEPSNRPSELIAKRSKKIGAIAGVLFILALVVYFTISSRKSIQPELSIAVLPFKNLSVDSEQEYFSDGLTEEIIDRLAKIKALRIISSTSSFQYKGIIEKSLPEIGKELNVSYILEGSVRREGEKVKVVAQLIEASTDQYLWSETIEKNGTDIFEIQLEIANKIARYLQPSLTVNEKGELVKIPTQSIEAYDLILRAKALIRKVRPAATEQALTYFRRALLLDPSFAEAYEGVAGCFRAKSEIHNQGPDLLDSGLVYADRALQLNSSSAKAYQIKGMIYNAKGEWEIAKIYFLKSRELEPGSGSNSLASYMLRMQKLDSAVFYSNEQIKYNPTETWAFIRRSEIFEGLGLLDSSLMSAERACYLDPELYYSKARKARILIKMKRYDQAIDYVNESILKTETEADLLIDAKLIIATGYAFKKDWKIAKAFLEQNNLINYDLMALVHVKLGESLQASKLIERKKVEYQRDKDTLSLAKMAVLENDPETAVKLILIAYKNFHVGRANILRQPIFKELEEERTFKKFMSSLDAKNKIALANIEKMRKQGH